MAFGIGVNTLEPNAGEMPVKRKSVACQCWFTSTGNSTPLMIKFEDENGEIQVIKEITVLYSEKKNYAGISTIEYACEIVFYQQQYNVKLIFIQDECKWVMLM